VSEVHSQACEMYWGVVRQYEFISLLEVGVGAMLAFSDLINLWWGKVAYIKSDPRVMVRGGRIRLSLYSLGEVVRGGFPL
jgi:hypothetical protein